MSAIDRIKGIVAAYKKETITLPEAWQSVCAAADEEKPAPEVTRKQIADVGLNIWGLDLFVESVAGKNDAKTFQTFSFIHRGIKITLEAVSDVDTKHY